MPENTSETKDNIIFHIDMNSYFASCEQQANSFLRGKPIGVCEHLGGIIIAPSIEAKKLGIKTGTPVWEAKKIYPKIELLYTDPEKYREITRRFLNIFYSYTERVEKYSIDEAFLDMSENLRPGLFAGHTQVFDPWEKARSIGLEIKKRMLKEVGDWIRCSIGVGENKLIAKIASDLQKPDGLVVVSPKERPELYNKLKLTDIPGIAKRTERNLNLLGINSLAELRDYPAQNLVAHFGIMGHHLHQMGQLEGSWKAGFPQPGEESGTEEAKSMGHAYTLPAATNDPKIVLQVLYKLSEMVGRRLRDASLTGNIIHFILNGADYRYFGHSKKLGYSTQDGKEIFAEAADIFEKTKHFKTGYRLVGVTVAGLKAHDGQRFLFEDDRRKKELVKYLDKINDKYGEFTVAAATAWQARNVIRDSIGFGRMKEFKVRYNGRKG